MKNIDLKDVGMRAFKTFVQTFISIAIAQIAGVDFIRGEDIKSVLISIAISAGAAGISAVWNAVINPLFDYLLGGKDNES